MNRDNRQVQASVSPRGVAPITIMMICGLGRKPHPDGIKAPATVVVEAEA